MLFSRPDRNPDNKKDLGYSACGKSTFFIVTLLLELITQHQGIIYPQVTK